MYVLMLCFHNLISHAAVVMAGSGQFSSGTMLNLVTIITEFLYVANYNYPGIAYSLLFILSDTMVTVCRY